jgi:hypothetical protein
VRDPAARAAISAAIDRLLPEAGAGAAFTDLAASTADAALTIGDEPLYRSGAGRGSVSLLHSVDGAVESVSVDVACGDSTPAVEGSLFVATPYHKAMLAAMVVDHAAGRDFCVVGEKGSGKSALVGEFARRLGYETEVMPLFQDMSARDLLQV